MADLEANISVEDNCISLTFNAFSSVLSDYIVEIIKRIQSFDPSKYQQEFEALKNKWCDGKWNFYMAKPVSQCYSTLMLFAGKNRFDEKTLFEHEHEVKFADFCQINSTFLKNGYLNWLITGNLSHEQALSIASRGQQTFNLQPCNLNDLYKLHPFVLESNTEILYSVPVENPDEINSAVAQLYQGRLPVDHKEKVLYEVMYQMFDEPTFNTLRTKESLGYIAQFAKFSIRDVQGGIVIIQSNQKDPQFIT